MPIGKSIVLAGRALVNSIAGVSDIDEIAPSRRIYAGGGGSVRGFGYQQLGPKDAQNNPIGGLTSTEFALEARYRFGNFGIVPFFDGGRVGETVDAGLQRAALRHRHRRALLHQFRAAALRRRDADQAPAGRIEDRALHLDRAGLLMTDDADETVAIERRPLMAADRQMGGDRRSRRWRCWWSR